MNLTDAVSVCIGGKPVRSILLDGRRVFTDVMLVLTTDKEYILTGESATVNLESDLKEKNVELFEVIGMTRTKIDTLTTDENGQATYTYTGTGAGQVGFVAVYDEKESNTVVIDDYTPVTSNISLTGGGEFIQGATVSLVASCTDQHGQAMGSGVTVTYYENGASIGTASTVSGVATLNISSLSVGTHMITANVGNVVSNAGSVVITEAPTPVASSIDLTGTKSILSYADSESSVLTATVLDSNDDPVEGVLVNIYKGSDLWYSASSDSSGEVSKTYASAGSGDIVFTAEVDSTLLTKTFAIRDAVYYNSGTLTNTEKIISNVPVNFKLTFIQRYTGSNLHASWFEYGTDSNNVIFAGQVGASSGGFLRRVNGTNSNIQSNNGVFPSANTDYNVEISYEDGVHTFKGHNTTYTLSETHTARSYCKFLVERNATAREILIMPL